jgi:hypothetical protein
MITLERLDDIQCGRGASPTADELIELAKAYRSVRRQIRSLVSFRDRIDWALRELDDLVAPTVAPVIVDAEVESP